MLSFLTPNGGQITTRKGHYTGYAADGTTVVNANLKPGAVLQLAGVIPSGSTASLGEAVCRPTEGYCGPAVVVPEDWQASDQTVINTQDGQVANLRRGGKIDVIISGYCRALVKHGTALVSGITLLSPTDGANHLTPYAGSGLLGAITSASSAVVDSVNTEQTPTTGGSIVVPANTLKAGDFITGVVNVGAITGGAGTLTIRVKIGSNIIAVSGAPVIVTGDFVTVKYAIQVRTAGASGTAVACGLSYAGTNGVAAGAADIPDGSGLASFTLDTTAATTISVTAQWSTTASTSSCAVQIHAATLFRLPTSLASKPVAVAMETGTVTDSVNSTEALAKILLFSPMV